MDEPPVPSGDQTPEQAMNLRIAAVRYIVKLDGEEPPSEDEIRAAASRAGTDHGAKGRSPD
jgi:hypothetical protein